MMYMIRFGRRFRVLEIVLNGNVTDRPRLGLAFRNSLTLCLKGMGHACLYTNVYTMPSGHGLR